MEKWTSAINNCLKYCSNQDLSEKQDYGHPHVSMGVSSVHLVVHHRECVCMRVCVCTHMRMCYTCVYVMHIFRSQSSSSGDLHQDLPTILFEMRFLTEQEFLTNRSLSSQQTQKSLCLSLPSVRVTEHTTMPGVFVWVLRIELRSSCLDHLSLQHIT